MDITRKNPKMRNFLFLLLALALVAGCGIIGPKPPAPGAVPSNLEGRSAEELFAMGEKAMKTNLDSAIAIFEALEAQYPYGHYAHQAQINIAYAYYKKGDRESALAAIDRFIRLHPTHPRLDYAYYLKGLVSYRQQMDWIYRLGRQDVAERDPAPLLESFDAFKALITRFPDSAYAADARKKLQSLSNILAENELRTAKYYFHRKAYLASLNRCKAVLENFQGTPASEEALALMAKSFDALGKKEEAADTLRILRRTFPKSQYLAKD